jgi:hypothetical protein
MLQFLIWVKKLKLSFTLQIKTIIISVFRGVLVFWAIADIERERYEKRIFRIGNWRTVGGA